LTKYILIGIIYLFSFVVVYSPEGRMLPAVTVPVGQALKDQASGALAELLIPCEEDLAASRNGEWTVHIEEIGEYTASFREMCLKVRLLWALQNLKQDQDQGIMSWRQGTLRFDILSWDPDKRRISARIQA
jgi:hypothetical protein